MTTLKLEKSENLSYQWQAKNAAGEKQSGVYKAKNKSHVRVYLRKCGLVPVKVVRQHNIANNLFKEKITKKEISIFTRQIAAMLKAGVPLVRALDIIQAGQKNKSLLKVISELKEGIEQGLSFSESLSRYPKQFDSLMVHLVDAGEKSGTLDTLLEKIALAKEKELLIARKTKKALIYPVFVIAVAIIVVGILLYFVVPKFEALFSEFGTELPLATTLMIALSHWIAHAWWILLLLCLLVNIVLRYVFKKSEQLVLLRDQFLLRIPLAGKIIYQSAIARFFRTLSILSVAGIPLDDALLFSANASGNQFFSKKILKIREEITSGIQLNVALRDSKIFPSVAVQMVSVGEESGTLDTLSAKIAQFYEEQVDAMIDVLAATIEPAIMLLLGLIVGGLLISIYLPIIKLSQVI